MIGRFGVPLFIVGQLGGINQERDDKATWQAADARLARPLSSPPGPRRLPRRAHTQPEAMGNAQTSGQRAGDSAGFSNNRVPTRLARRMSRKPAARFAPCHRPPLCRGAGGANDAVLLCLRVVYSRANGAGAQRTSK